MRNTLKELMAHKIVIDFETFYTSKYSLTKTPMQNYICDPAFEIIGASVKLNNQPTLWFSGTLAEMREWLKQYPWESSYVVAHNAAFDGAILEWIVGVKPRFYVCTASMGRAMYSAYTGSASLDALSKHLEVGTKGTEVLNALGMRRRDFSEEQLERYGQYCTNDVVLTDDLYQHMIRHYPPAELRLIDATVKKFTRPAFELDKRVLSGRLTEVKKEAALTLAHAAGLLGVDSPEDAKAVLMSNPKFAIALAHEGIDPPMKISPTTGKETFALAKSDLGFQALLEHDNPRVQQLAEARLKTKSTIEITRLQRFRAITDLPVQTGKLAVPLKYFGGHTGRFSGASMLNVQNLPRGGALRRALRAPAGHKVVAADLSQIEVRVLAALAGQEKLLTAFREGRDIYCEFATSLYGRTITKDDKFERFIGKAAVLGCGYGLGAKAFRDYARALGGVEVSEMEAYRAIKAYRRTYPRVPELWRAMDEAVLAMAAQDHAAGIAPVHFSRQRLRLPSGMFINYPELRYDQREDSYVFKKGRLTARLWGGTLTENVVQALARIILTDAELRLRDRGVECALSVHDELVTVVPDADVDRVSRLMETEMTRKVEWMPQLPLACEVSHGQTYADAK